MTVERRGTNSEEGVEVSDEREGFSASRVRGRVKSIRGGQGELTRVRLSSVVATHRVRVVDGGKQRAHKRIIKHWAGGRFGGRDSKGTVQYLKCGWTVSRRSKDNAQACAAASMRRSSEEENELVSRDRELVES